MDKRTRGKVEHKNSDSSFGFERSADVKKGPASVGPVAHVGPQIPVGGGVDERLSLIPDNPVISVTPVAVENPEAVAVAVETAPSVGDLDKAIPDVVVEDLPDGTRIRTFASGGVQVETPTPAPYRNPTS